MTASLVLDGRCRGLRRQLGPVAWTVLEEAALSSVESSEGLLWAPITVRSAAGSLGVGRESATRAIGILVSAGLLRRSQRHRAEGGRFGPGGYWLLVPAGLTVTGVDRAAVSAEPGAGGPRPVRPAMVSAGSDLRRTIARGGGGRRDKPDAVPVVQASLFTAAVGEEGAGLVAAGGAPRVGVESVGAVSLVGCGVVSRVHELAPGVRAGAGPGMDPRPVTGGDGGC